MDGVPVLATDSFHAFSPSHLVVLAIFVLGCVAVVLVGRRDRGTGRETRLRRILAVVVLVVLVAFQVASFLPGEYDVDTSYPIQLCDLAWLSAAYALWTLRPWAIALTYYWGLTLTVQGIVTPSLGEAFPDPRFFGFWCRHLFVVWAAVYLTWGIGRRHNWRGYRLTLVVTLAWAVLVGALNALVGSNYGYLNRKPASASILDAMGPWPWYVAAEVVVLMVVWALITWPWVAIAARRSGGSSPRRT